ncbi:MAG: hypothetical protein JW770_01230, partial [Actinobacteria bacterium]|nr:hypothetical protein [Actinomycetota bacterium]
MYDINYMNQYKNSQEYFSRYRIPSGCAVFGVMNQAGLVFDGSTAVEGISLMHDRSNGLGGGFAAYGIYPQYRDDWAFHMFYDDILAKRETEDLLEKYFKILFSEEIPTRKVHGVSDPPIIYRYFLKSGNDIFINREGVGIDDGKGRSASGVSHCISGLMEEDFIVDFVMKVNAGVNGAYI